MMEIRSKLPQLGTTIFTTMSALAKKHKAINLSQGFPDFDCSRELQDRVNYHLRNNRNQYAPMAGVPRLREMISQKTHESYGCSINVDSEITITAGATQGIFTAIQAFVSKGDEVIIIEPAYDSYRPALDLVGASIISYVLKYPDYKINWASFSDLVTDRTKMIIINTPHNPTGTVLDQNDMEVLESIVRAKNIIVLSDEVYEHLIYNGLEHQSILKFPNLFKQSIAVYSFGKTFHCTGWKMGYVIAPEYLMSEFRKVHQFNVFSVNSFVQHGIADYLQEPKHYNDLPKFFQEKRDCFEKAMEASKFKPIPSKGSYFQLYDYSAISDLDDMGFAVKLTQDFGVATIPLSPFRKLPLDEKVVRFCFAKNESTLISAAKKLKLINRVF